MLLNLCVYHMCVSFVDGQSFTILRVKMSENRTIPVHMFLKGTSLNMNVFLINFFAVKLKGENIDLLLYIDNSAMILLVQPTWHLNRLYVAPELKWAWHPLEKTPSCGPWAESDKFNSGKWCDVSKSCDFPLSSQCSFSTVRHCNPVCCVSEWHTQEVLIML